MHAFAILLLRKDVTFVENTEGWAHHMAFWFGYASIKIELERFNVPGGSMHPKLFGLVG